MKRLLFCLIIALMLPATVQAQDVPNARAINPKKGQLPKASQFGGGKPNGGDSGGAAVQRAYADANRGTVTHTIKAADLKIDYLVQKYTNNSIFIQEAYAYCTTSPRVVIMFGGEQVAEAVVKPDQFESCKQAFGSSPDKATKVSITGTLAGKRNTRWPQIEQVERLYVIK